MKEEFIQFAPLFAGLTPSDQKLLSDRFVQNSAATGTVLFQAGDNADGLYLVGSGFVRLFTAGGSTLATLGPGSVLGEDSLYRALPYDVSAHAVSALEYWKLTDADLRAIIVQYPAVGLKLSQNFGSLIAQMQNYLVQQLGKTAELNGLPRHTLQAIADQLEPRKVGTGQPLYRAGDTAGGLFLVESGRIEIRPDSADGERQEAGAGQLLGALALLTNKAQTATATAREETLLWALSVEDFQSIASRQPGLRRSLGRKVSARLSRTDQAQAAFRLAQMPIFAQLPQAALQGLAQRMVLQHVPAGERVYRIGELGDAFYLVESGEIELTAENAVGIVEETGRIGANGFFGELSLLTGQIRDEDATATRNTNLWVLPKAQLDEVAIQNPAVGKALSQGVATRLASASRPQEELSLRQFVLLADLNPADLKQIVPLLHPMRYRAGEIIYRTSTPADTLYLVEKGTVRVQMLNGGAYLVGPGETLGERALITEQPHNTTVSADTDVDLWTLGKQDLDLLMNRYPAIAISLTRIISQRMAEMPSVPAGGPGQPARAAEMAPARRRHQAAALPESDPPRRRRRSLSDWYGSLSPGARLRFMLLLLLLLVLLCLTLPFTAMTILNGIGAASRAVAATLDNALDSVYASGSVQIAEAAADEAERLRPTPEAVVAAAAPRQLDSRLQGLGVTIEDAQVQPGQPYWRLVEVRWEDEQQAGGKHHIYVDVMDENGKRVQNQPVTVFWGDGSHTAALEDKPAPDFGFNYQMYAAGYAYGVKVEGLPSDVLRGAGLGDLTKRFHGIHVAYYLTYQRAVR
ncbi:MAG: cyclic nucleotide-binding domain-containing protein [Caldilinea sp.]|nr:cyclic nucleotide-binding domain-containing protein [Caldilinea sp.]